MAETATMKIDWLTLTGRPFDSRYDNQGNKLAGNRFNDKYYNKDWSKSAKEKIESLIDELSKQNQIFQEPDFVVGGSLAKVGYTVQYDFVFGKTRASIGYHPTMEYMGICFQMSGSALAVIRGSMGSGAEITLVRLFDSWARDWGYNPRASRVDFAADYYDYDFTVSDYIKKYHEDGPCKGVVRQAYENKENKIDYKKVSLSTQVISQKSERLAETLYFGAISSSLRLAIYNKYEENKIEEKKKSDLSLDFNSWVRFEARFKNEYATSIYNSILKCEDDENLYRLGYSLLLSKFNLCYLTDSNADEKKDKEEYVKDWIVLDWENRFEGKIPVIKGRDKTSSTWDDLFANLVDRSGVITLLQKTIGVFEGRHKREHIKKAFFKYISDVAESRENSHDTENFIYRHAGDSISELPFAMYVLKEEEDEKEEEE